MPTTRGPLDRGRRPTFPPALRQKAARYLVLHDAHIEAIQAPGDSHPFYVDGRHEELCQLSSEVCGALGIRSWEDAATLVEEAIRHADD